VNGSAGLKLVALSGDVERPGVYEVPMGTPLREIIALGGGVAGGRELLAVAPGGASSGFLSAEQLDLPLDFDALARAGSMLGSAALLVVAEGRDLLELATSLVAFFRNESCGKCVPCRIGTEKAVILLEAAGRGEGVRSQLPLLAQLERTLAETSLCGLGQVALRPFVSALACHPAEVERGFRKG
jgi:NADH:ubiquinone oxidoreductase subunit F (NADH-binding)